MDKAHINVPGVRWTEHKQVTHSVPQVCHSSMSFQSLHFISAPSQKYVCALVRVAWKGVPTSPFPGTVCRECETRAETEPNAAPRGHHFSFHGPRCGDDASAFMKCQ